MQIPSHAVLAGLLVLAGAGSMAFRGQDDAALLKKKLDDHPAGFWVYDDLKLGFERAKESGKPLLVSIRCVP